MGMPGRCRESFGASRWPPGDPAPQPGRLAPVPPDRPPASPASLLPGFTFHGTGLSATSNYLRYLKKPHSHTFSGSFPFLDWNVRLCHHQSSPIPASLLPCCSPFSNWEKPNLCSLPISLPNPSAIISSVAFLCTFANLHYSPLCLT